MFPLVVFAQDVSLYDGTNGHQYEGALTVLKNEGVMKGYSDGLFRPEAVINRAEFLKIVLLAHHIDAGGENCFPDVRNEWFAQWICAAAARGIATGYPDGFFRPEQTVSFVEAAKMIVTASGVPLAESSPWYKGFTQYLASKKSIPSSITGFDHLVTRGETAAMVWLLRGNDQPYESLSPEEQGWYIQRQTLQDTSLDYETIQSYTPSDHLLDFIGTGKKVVVNGTKVNWLCTPAFSNEDAEHAAWNNKDSDTFFLKYCPHVHGSPAYTYSYFPYFANSKAFTRVDPGGFQEMRLMTDAEIRAYEKQLTLPVNIEAGVKTWSQCKTEHRLLADGINARTLTCTYYHQEDVPNAPANWLIPNTHCFLPVAKNLSFVYRIPMATLDAGEDGCRHLRWWGIRSIRLK